VHKIANKPLILRKKDSKYRGKLKVITLETSTNKEKKDDKDIDEESVVEMAASTPAWSRRTRRINLPKRYRD